MWSTVALNISPPSSALRCVRVRARFFRSLFISGPSEPPRLITVAYMPSDPSAPFQLAARMRGKPGEQRQNKKKTQGVGTQTTPRAHVFFFHVALQSCQGFQLRGAGESSSEPRRKHSAAAVRCCSSTSLPAGKRAQAGGEGSRDHNGVPQGNASNEG